MDDESRVRQARIDRQAVAAGPKLPEHIRQAVLALVQANSTERV